MAMRRPGLDRLAGFTFIEMMIVFVVLGIMTTMMVRSVRGSWYAASRRAATRDVTAYLFRDARSRSNRVGRHGWSAAATS